MANKGKEEIGKRILLVHNFYKVSGGEDTVFYNEKELLEENGNTVFAYTKQNSEIDGYSIFQKLLLPLRTIFSFKVYKDISKIVKKEKIDIIHVHNTLPLISPAVYYAGIHNNVPVIQTMHNYRLLCPNGLFFRANHICEDCVSKGLKCSIKHKCYRNSRVQTAIIALMIKINKISGIYSKINYICMTEFNRDKLLTFNQIDEKRIYIKPHFINKLSTDKNRKRHGFVYASRLSIGKNILELLQIWKEIDDKEMLLTVCGDGPLRKECEEYCKNNNLPNVVFKGNLKHEQLFDVMASAEALIFPTKYYETFGMSIIEANAVGTPVIGPNLGNVANMIIDNRTGIKYIPDVKEDLKNKILFVHKNPIIVDESVVKKWDKDTNYEILNDIYNDIIIKNENNK